MKRISYFFLGASSVASLWIIHELKQTKETNPILKYGNHGPTVDVLARESFVVSYNRQNRNPFWVAEHLNSNDFHSGDRKQSHFKEDSSIPLKFRSRLADYKNSSFDRGHMAPAADVKNSQEALNESFLLTNISPQVGKGFNRSYWFYLEAFIRDLTSSFDDVFIVTGPLFLPKPNEEKFYTTFQVLNGNTAVPTHFFKVVLAEKNDKRAIAGFVLPNEPLNDVNLTQFLVPIDAIEKASGLEFFPQLNRKNLIDLCTETECTFKKQLIKRIKS